MRGKLILLCGGNGRRMCGAVADKILMPLAGTPVVAHSAKAFCEIFTAGTIICVYRDEEQRREVEAALAEFCGNAEIFFVQGGKERRDSVLNGLRAAGTREDELVFIHDAARPLVTAEAFGRLAQAAAQNGAAVLAHKCVNTIKRCAVPAADGDAVLLEDLDRSRLWEMETPQVFRGNAILEAYERVVAQNLTVTDDVSAYTAVFKRPVTLVENARPNIKITVPADLQLLKTLI
ncbi:MAG: 2-C-methyl-D-erythritol 4-phosphate cytidylyltransferase [Opitutales bacterium]|nr:2-C-methyl-D-erythritol 4-phosphate cytidylyltransferase [Opitutales bacterium]